MTLARAILWKRPGAKFTLQGDQLDPHIAPSGDPATGLQWEGPGERPTRAEVAQWLVEYRDQRRDVIDRATADLSALQLAAMVDVLAVRLNVDRTTLATEIRAAYVARALALAGG